MLSPDGVSYIQVPRRFGTLTDEDPSAPVEERIRRFGQDDHVRFYGDDFERRLTRGGLFPMVVVPSMCLEDEETRRMGIGPEERVWVCRSRRIPHDYEDRADLLIRVRRAEEDSDRIRSHRVVRAMLKIRRAILRLRQRS